MSPRQSCLFEAPKKARIVRAHVVDAGNGPDSKPVAQFECRACGWRSFWRPIANVTEGKRGIACPCCNGPEAA